MEFKIALIGYTHYGDLGLISSEVAPQKSVGFEDANLLSLLTRGSGNEHIAPFLVWNR